MLLQLSHPAVARAIAEHSYTLRDIVRRFYTTFDRVFAVYFDEWSSARRAAVRVHRVHERIDGTLADGRRYTATDEAAARFVYAVSSLSVTVT